MKSYSDRSCEARDRFVEAGVSHASACSMRVFVRMPSMREAMVCSSESVENMKVGTFMFMIELSRTMVLKLAAGPAHRCSEFRLMRMLCSVQEANGGGRGSCPTTPILTRRDRRCINHQPERLTWATH